MKQVRQGDVFLVPILELPAAAKPTGHLVLAEGEVTGHSHRVVVGPDAEATLLTSAENERFLRIVGTGAQLIHEEHGAVGIEPGRYRVVIGEEWSDALEPIRVAD